MAFTTHDIVTENVFIYLGHNSDTNKLKTEIKYSVT